jgi:D-glycero-D-manno-heptose 1,7-bisphosphate phosphatase
LSRFTTVFLDRDGVINRKAPEGAYITNVDELELLPGAGPAIRRLNEAGVKVIVVTNQRGIALGKMSEDDYFEIAAALDAKLAESGAHIDRTYFCPHEKGVCDCRKPEPGMIIAAMRDDHDIDPSRSVLVGDSPSDIQAANSAHLAKAILICSNRDGNIRNLASAVDLVLAESANSAIRSIHQPVLITEATIASSTGQWPGASDNSVKVTHGETKEAQDLKFE